MPPKTKSAPAKARGTTKMCGEYDLDNLPPRVYGAIYNPDSELIHQALDAIRAEEELRNEQKANNKRPRVYSSRTLVPGVEYDCEVDGKHMKDLADITNDQLIQSMRRGQYMCVFFTQRAPQIDDLLLPLPDALCTEGPDGRKNKIALRRCTHCNRFRSSIHPSKCIRENPNKGSTDRRRKRTASPVAAPLSPLPVRQQHQQEQKQQQQQQPMHLQAPQFSDCGASVASSVAVSPLSCISPNEASPFSPEAGNDETVGDVTFQFSHPLLSSTAVAAPAMNANACSSFPSSNMFSLSADEDCKSFPLQTDNNASLAFPSSMMMPQSQSRSELVHDSAFAAAPDTSSSMAFGSSSDALASFFSFPESCSTAMTSMTNCELPLPLPDLSSSTAPLPMFEASSFAAAQVGSFVSTSSDLSLPFPLPPLALHDFAGFLPAQPMPFFAPSDAADEKSFGASSSSSSAAFTTDFSCPASFDSVDESFGSCVAASAFPAFDFVATMGNDQGLAKRTTFSTFEY